MGRLSEIFIGKTYGSWTVLRKDKSRNQSAYFVCKCTCGNEQSVRARSILFTKGACHECKYRIRSMRHTKKYDGAIFGEWTVLSDDKSDDDHRYMKCRCSCGETESVLLSSLTSKRSTKCAACHDKVLSERNHHELIGKKFGKWTVLSPHKVIKSYWHYNCRCDCGMEKPVLGTTLTSGRSTKCRNCQNKIAATKHGLSHAPEYKVWCSMLARCFNVNDGGYPYYGAKGIKVCERWNDFNNFIEDMGMRPSPEFDIDRFDSNGDYTPENCRWIHRSLNRSKKDNLIP